MFRYVVSVSSKATTASEARLVMRIAQGDREALADLYDLYANLLYSLAVYILNDPREAEVVVHKVFINIWDDASSFTESLGSPFSWAMVLTRNRSIDRLRSDPRHLLAFKDQRVNSFQAAWGDPELACESIGPNACHQTRLALEGLPDDCRYPIELAFFRGLTHTEIADVLQEPLSTVKARIAFGLSQCLLRNEA